MSSNPKKKAAPEDTLLLTAVPYEVWDEADRYAWDDTTLDLLVDRLRGTDPVEYTGHLHPFEGLFMDAAGIDADLHRGSGYDATVFVMRGIYEAMFGERVSKTEILDTHCQTLLFTKLNPSWIYPQTFQALPYSEGTIMALLTQLWNRQAVIPSPSGLSPTLPWRPLGSYVRRPGLRFNDGGSIQVFAGFLAHPNLGDKNLYSWVVKIGNRFQGDRYDPSTLLVSAVGNRNASTRTLKAAAKVSKTTDQNKRAKSCAEDVAEGIVIHPNSTPKFLKSLVDAKTIAKADVLNNQHRAQPVRIIGDPFKRQDVRPEPGKNKAVSKTKILNGVLDGRLGKPVPKGFPVPDVAWETFFNSPSDSFALYFDRDRVWRMMNEAAPPPHRVTLRLLFSEEDRHSLWPLYYAGSAVAWLRGQAAEAGFSVDDVPLEWLAEVYR